MAPSISKEYGEHHLERSVSKKQQECNGYHEDAETVVSYDNSPYEDTTIVSILVGQNATPFMIHSTILAQSEVLAAKVVSTSTAGQKVLAPELDRPTAHTLIGYMYTGIYKDLPSSSQTKTSAVSNYETGTCVYCAAVRYQLAGLAELAKRKIISLEEEVGISDVLRMAKDRAYPLLPEDETWYPAYLEGAIKSAMAKDPEPFQRPDFITQVEGNSRLLQVVWKTVISNYASAVTVPSSKDDDSNMTGREDQSKGDVATLESQPPASVDGSQTTAVANDTPADPPSPETPYSITTTAAAPFEDHLKLDDIEPTVETHQIPEPFTDELGFEKSKMYQKMSKNEPDPSSAVVSAVDQERPAHERSDSVMQDEDVVMTPTKQAEAAATAPVEEAEEADKIGEVSPLIANGSVDAAAAVKKTKKKKKTGKSSIVF